MHIHPPVLLAASLLDLSGPCRALANAPDVVRLGNPEICPLRRGCLRLKDYCSKYNLKVEERMFPKALLDIMPAICRRRRSAIAPL